MDFAHIYREGSKENLYYYWFSAMHTRVDVVMLGKKEKDFFFSVSNDIYNRVKELELLGNCFNPQSELSKFNEGRLEQSYLSKELQYIISICDGWKERTNGLFDVGFSGIIDLSGFLKGYALDQVLPILRKYEITSALVNLGNSSILAIGSKGPECEGWEVRNFNDEIFLLKNQCLTTSGNNTADRIHVFNPETGDYIKGKLSVSVVTDTGTEGEVMSTVEFIKQGALIDSYAEA